MAHIKVCLPVHDTHGDPSSCLLTRAQSPQREERDLTRARQVLCRQPGPGLTRAGEEGPC